MVYADVNTTKEELNDIRQKTRCLISSKEFVFEINKEKAKYIIYQ